MDEERTFTFEICNFLKKSVFHCSRNVYTQITSSTYSLDKRYLKLYGYKRICKRTR